MAYHEGHEGVLFYFGVFYESGRGVQKDLKLAAHFYCLAVKRNRVAAQNNLAVMVANGKGVKRELEKVLALILIAEQNNGLNPNARLRLNQFQAVIEGLLNTALISRTEWQEAELFGTRIEQRLKSNLQSPNRKGDAVSGHKFYQSCCLAEQEIAGNSLLKGD